MWIVTIIYWLQAFAGPVILLGLAGIAFAKNVETVIVMAAIGAVAGIVFAEYIRRKYGLSTFFSRIYGPNQMDETTKKDHK